MWIKHEFYQYGKLSQDAAAINEWRFSKLKEHRDRNIEVENEAFDRYVQNISLLEEVFSVKSITDGSNEDESTIANPDSNSVEDSEMMTSGHKLKLRSNPTRSENFRRRMAQIVDQGLKKLQHELNDKADDLNDQKEFDKGSKKAKFWWSDRSIALSDIIDKLNKARSDEDPKSYLKLKYHLHNLHAKSSETETQEYVVSEMQTEKDMASRKESGYILPKLFTTDEIDQETLNSVDAHFCSLENIEDL